MCANVAAEGEDGGEVYLQHGVPVFGGEEVGGVAALDAAAIEEDGDAEVGVRGEDGGEEGGDGGVGGEVGRVDGGGAAEGFDGEFGGLVGAVALDQQDIRSSFSQRQSHCLPYPPRTTRHQRRLALERKQLLHRIHGR